MAVQVTTDLEENIRQFETLFSDCADIKKRRIKVGQKLGKECYIAYIEVAISNTDWKDSAVGKLLQTLRSLPEDGLVHYVEQNVEDISDSQPFRTIEDAAQGMLTGDALGAAQAVAEQLGLDQFYAQLLPADKVERVEALLEEKRPREKLVFVGDGINDAPVLSRADIGVAMGALGSDAAIEAADIVLMDDDLLKLPVAVRIARKTLSIVRQNVVFALGVKLLVLILSAVGLANMWAAVFADVGVSVLAILNASRMLKAK